MVDKVLKVAGAIADVIVNFIAASVVVCVVLYGGVYGYYSIRRGVIVAQQLPAVRSRFDAAFVLPNTVLLNEHVGWAICGNSEVSSAVYTRLYLSKLPHREIESQFSPVGQIRVHFIDSAESGTGSVEWERFFSDNGVSHLKG